MSDYVPEHGTATRYNHWGCRCTPCRKARYVQNVRLQMGHHTRLPSRLTRRRLQALACRGWGIDMLAERTGLSRETLDRQRSGKNRFVMPHVAAIVEETYAALWTTQAPLVKSSKTAAIASRNGWSPPHPALLAASE